MSALDDGQLGVFAHFKNCLFTENSAVEVGGAFGVAFYILAQSAQSILPLQFIDWLVQELGFVLSLTRFFCAAVTSLAMQ